MPITRLGPDVPLLNFGSGATTQVPSGGGSGQVVTSNGSNGAYWGENIARITANGSNTLVGPFVSVLSGSGVSFAVSSNALTISAGGSGQFLEVTGGGKGTVSNLGSLGTTETINVSTANYFYGTLDDNVTIGFSGWTAGVDSQITVELTEDGGGGNTPTFSGVTWLGGTTPTHDTTASSTAVYVFFSRDGGITIIGGLLGGASSSSSSGAVGPILIADSHSTPLVFADLLQTEAGDDLLYLDP